MIYARFSCVIATRHGASALGFLPLQTAGAVEFTVAPVVRGQGNGGGRVATAGAVELIFRVFESPLNIENFVVFWCCESLWFNRCRGCGTLIVHFTPDDRGYGELNRCRDSLEV